MTDEESIKKYEALLNRLGKRPRTVLELILKNGSVSTYELGQLGYDQPPRAAQDLKEAGVSLKVSYGRHHKTGSRMAIYSLADIIDENSFLGRRHFPKRFRQEILQRFDYKCNICNTTYPARILQLDHRVPYIVGGEGKKLYVEDYQPLCGSHQRSKSWECEHCPNRIERILEVCRTCYWACPDGNYTHVATRPERRTDITWSDAEEIELYEKLQERASREGKDISSLLKDIAAHEIYPEDID